MSTIKSTPSNYTYKPVGSGLDAWKNIARGIRQASRGGASYPPFSASNFIDSSKLGAYYTGAGIIAAILFICILVSLVGGIGQCCALTICRKRLHKKHNLFKSKKPPGLCQKICALVWVVFITVFFLVGSFASYTGGSVFGNSVVGLGNAGISVLNSTTDLVSAAAPAASAWFDALNSAVSNGVDKTTSYIDTSKLTTTGVIPSLTSLGNGMNTLSTDTKALLTKASTLDTNLVSSQSQMNTLAISVSAIIAEVAGYNSSGSTFSDSTGSGTYTVTSISTSTDPESIARIAKGHLDATQTVGTSLDALKSVTVSAPICATQALTQATQMPILVNNKVIGQGDGVKTALSVQLGKTKNSVVSSLTTMSTSAKDLTKSGTTTLDSFISQAKSINNSRNIAMCILSSLVLLVLVGLYFFGYQQKPKRIKGCNLVATPLYFIIQIIAVTLFLMSVVFGDICSSVFDYSPPPINVALGSGGAAAINKIMALRDQCSAGYSILTIAVNIDLVSADSINTTKLCNDAIDLVDFSPLAGVDLSSLVIIVPAPAAVVAGFNTTNVNSLSITNLNSLIDTDLPQLKISLTYLKGNITASGIFSQSGSGNATGDYLVKKNALNMRIDALISTNGTIDQLSALATTARTSLGQIPIDFATLKTNASLLPGYYSSAQSNMAVYQSGVSTSLTDGTPIIKANIKNDVSTASDVLYKSMNCTGIGSSVFTLQDEMCGQFLGGLDILWLAYAVIALFAALSMPAIIWVANRLFYNNLAYVNLGESPVSSPVKEKPAAAKEKPAAAKKNSIIKSFPAPISSAATTKPFSIKVMK